MPIRYLGWIVFTFGVLTLPLACGHWPLDVFQADLIEAEIQQVAACEQVGALSESLDTGRIITPLARREMVAHLKERALALGATHLVWVYRTDQTAAARAFRCAE
ncbi:MAG: hypothetical protein P8010_02035 [Desulfosarcinaceae bacterium]|jgi:hypothetical protein